MEEDLISKKELLELTGISYGQLYRWKRKQLIPEDWFIRKSAFTGQETFFPKERMLRRVHNIINMKGDLSLDELAEKLADTTSFAHAHLSLSAAQLLERNIVSKATLDRFGDATAGGKKYTFDQVVHLVAVDGLISKGDMNLDEADGMFRTLTNNTARFAGKSWELFFIRKMGASFFLLAAAPAELIFDEGTRLVSRLSLTDLVEQLNGKLN
ncbi:YhbD family protein [Paenibacillus pedocola]|uniref:YhbD family protein n=1 Tax=Paenibacillus pedocola TaxID=3242193 RepID=UPI002877A1DA|nr:YhbD family protein [Paenibacillus typhae]